MWGWAFTNVLTIAGILRGWNNPYFGLMVYYAFAILRPTFLWFWAFGGGERHSYLVALSTLAGWAMYGFGDTRNSRGMWLPMFGLTLYAAAGIFTWRVTAINPGWAYHNLKIMLKIVLMAWVAVSLIRTPQQIRYFAYIITASLGYLAWVFNSQYYFDKWNRIWLWGFGAIDNNGVAMTMVMGVPLAFFIGINDKRKWVQASCVVGVLCMVHVILFSFSRGGQLGLCMVGIVLFTFAFLVLPRKGLTVLAGIGVLWFALYFSGPEVRERFMSIFADKHTRDASAESRFVTWSAAWACMKEHPLGVGPRNFNIISHYYGLAPGKSVHNLYLQTGADYGFAGLFGMLLFYFGTAWNTYWMTFSKTAKRLVWPRYYGQMVCVSLAGFLVCSTFIGMESVEVGYIIALLGLCTTSYVHRVADTEDVTRPVEKKQEEEKPSESLSDMVPGYY